MDDLSERVPKKLTAKEIKDIRKLINQMISDGLTDEEIGSHIHKDWIPQLMEDPVDKRKQTRNPEREKQIRELLIKGMSMNKIAQELGVSIGTIQYWVKKIGPVEIKSGKKKAKGEVDSKENHKKWAEQIEKAGDYWLREEELLLKRLEQARKQQQDEQERKE
jgi:transposase